MPAQRLTNRRVAKPWGRRTLGPRFEDVALPDEPVGEIWFEPPTGQDHELLVKYLFTSERLSVQVHPDDATARAAGFARGKDEAWLILDAEPGAEIGLGTKRRLSADELRAAALDGSIDTLIEWQPVRVGQAIYSPAGTIHAIGAGLVLVEVQQNIDLTFRMFDYGRSRELHLDAGVAAAKAEPFVLPTLATGGNKGAVVCEGAKFSIERWYGALTPSIMPVGGRNWFVPLSGGGTIDKQPWTAGDCWVIEGSAAIELDGISDVLIVRGKEK